MFQAVPPPIIRSYKLYTQHRVFVKLFMLLIASVSEFHSLMLAVCLQFSAPDDGRRNRLKLVQHL